ncbi:Metallo-dependent phosphatase-like protein, partial [Cokeromyces recurvatus]|uniref:Metallo-dependent phosphatase-like protein n=1 Tax=Cokeromyces recurvatus TaxID=90255 RepID=UPI00222100A8
MRKIFSLSSYFYIVLLILTFIRAIHLYFISTKDLRIADENDHWFLKEHRQQKLSTATMNVQHSTTRMSNETNKLFYFIQLSDLHISKFQPKGHTIHFLHFLQSALPVIKPEFVVVTGDLIDAKDKTRTTSTQYVEEWQVYRSAVEQGANNTRWYDMRGNHDCFDLVSWQAENNFYRTFGKSAQDLDAGKGIYSWKVSKDYGDYNFIAVDACPKKGPSRPFNFFGYFTTNTMNRLASKIMSTTYNHTFIFAHYPTTTMIPGVSSEGYTLNDLASRFSIYFCGHLHRLSAGLGNILKSYHKETDSLELEVADMKDHGSYRIVAVDHDLVSFVDIDLPISEISPVNEDSIIPLTVDNQIIWPKQKLHPSPIVLITNPKDARFTMPTKEPLQAMGQSSYIRFLIFSEYDDLKVHVFVDDKQHPFPSTYIGRKALDDKQKVIPLWTTPWDPSEFNDGKTHYLRVEATAPNGKTGVSEIPFRLDNERVNINGGTGEWIIASSISELIRFLCIFAITSMLLTLIIPKLLNDYERHRNNFIEKNNLRNRLLLQIHKIDSSNYCSIRKFILIWMHRFLNFPEDQPYVWTLCFMFLTSLLILPWFKAEFIPSGQTEAESMGYFYLWGLLFEGQQWVPLDTWLFAIFQITFSVAVFILLFIWKSTNASLLQCKGNTMTTLLCDRVWFQILVLLYWFWRFEGLTDLAKFYGGIWPTLILNQLVWWLFIVAFLIIFDKTDLISKRKDRDESITLDICTSCDNASANNQHEFFVDNSLDNKNNEEQQDEVEESRQPLLHEESSSNSCSPTKNSFRRNISKI